MTYFSNDWRGAPQIGFDTEMVTRAILIGPSCLELRPLGVNWYGDELEPFHCISHHLGQHPPDWWPNCNSGIAHDVIDVFRSFVVSDQGLEWINLNPEFLESRKVPLNWRNIAYACKHGPFVPPEPIWWVPGDESILMPLTINLED